MLKDEIEKKISIKKKNLSQPGLTHQTRDPGQKQKLKIKGIRLEVKIP